MVEILPLDTILQGDAREALLTLPDNSVDMCVTSPPYFALRDYGMTDQIGQCDTPEQYVRELVFVFREVYRILKPSGTLWLNLGDSYYGTNGKELSGYKSKDLIGIPWMMAFALRDAGWYLRQDIVWAKGNPMPESVKDRCTKCHEYVFLLSKNRTYYFDHAAIREPCSESSIQDFKHRKTLSNKGGGAKSFQGIRPDLCRDRSDYYSSDFKRNKRDVWFINTKPYRGAHFAVFPPELVEPCILAGCPEGGVVLDPFFGSGTTGLVAIRHRRHFIGVELNPAYIALAEERIDKIKDKEEETK